MKQYPLYSVDRYDNFDVFVREIGRKYSTRPAISTFTRKGQEEVHTYQEMTDDVRAVREYLRIHGLSGRHIAIISENSYRWVIAYLAVASCGAVAVCIDAEQSDETIHQMLHMADVEFAFAADAYLPICRAVLPNDNLISLGDRAAENGVKLFGEVCRTGAASLQGQEDLVKYDINPQQTASVVFTSGTSSKPKPVMLSHQNLMHNAVQARLAVDTLQRIYTSLPLYHTYGMTCGVLSSLVDGSHVFLNGNLRTAIRDLRLSNANSMMTVPLMVEAICNQIWLEAEKKGKEKSLRGLMKGVEVLRKFGFSPRIKALEAIRQEAFGNIKMAVVGGAALSKRVADQMENLGLTVLQGYGITECSPLVAVNRNRFRCTESVGPLVPELECRIEDGEIWIRGKSVMTGYYKAPKLTEEAMEDGWFKTGDIGHIDEKGFLYVTGRKKNLIVFKNGKKIAPEKLEELIYAIPLVKEVVVFGTASGQDADDIKLAASIYPDPERTEGKSSYDILAELQNGIDGINARLPIYQHISMINIRKTPFERTGTKKIKRYGN